MQLVDNFKEDINKYKEKVSSLTNKECKDYLNNFINYVENSNYDGDVYVRDYFEKIYINGDYLLSYYLKGKDNCSSFTDEKAKEYDLPLMFLTASMQDDAIMSNYTTQYELNIKDNLIRLILEPDIKYIENSIKQRTELNIIKTIIKMAEEEALNEE